MGQRVEEALPHDLGDPGLAVHLGIRPGVAVEVAAPGLDQAELVGHPADRVDVPLVERPVVDLEATQANGLQVTHERFVGLRFAEVSQHGQTAGGPDATYQLPKASIIVLRGKLSSPDAANR